MVKKLFLLRHGQAASSFNTSDMERSLTPRGVSDIEQLGKFLKTYGFQPDLVYCSPAKRTRETCELLLKEVGFDGVVKFEKRIYEAEVTELFDLINATKAEASVILLIGHNPGLSYFCDYLTGNHYTGMSPGQMIQIEFDINYWNEISRGLGNQTVVK